MGLPGIRFGTVSPVADKIAEPVVSVPDPVNGFFILTFTILFPHSFPNMLIRRDSKL